LILLHSEDDTRVLAGRLAELLPPGTIMLLRGPLGAGKTTLVRYLARALGFEGRVTSPTYTLMHTYPTPQGNLLHVDVYRLPEPASIYELGFEEAREDARLTAVEWGNPADFPGALEVALEPRENGVRQVRLIGHAPELDELAHRIAASL